MKNILLLLTPIIISGCANPLYLSHTTTSMDSQQYYKDKTECKYYADATGPTSSQEYWTTTLYECMKGKGYFAVNKKGDKIEYKWCDSFDCFAR